MEYYSRRPNAMQGITPKAGLNQPATRNPSDRLLDLRCEMEYRDTVNAAQSARNLNPIPVRAGSIETCPLGGLGSVCDRTSGPNKLQIHTESVLRGLTAPPRQCYDNVEAMPVEQKDTLYGRAGKTSSYRGPVNTRTLGAVQTIREVDFHSMYPPVFKDPQVALANQSGNTRTRCLMQSQQIMVADAYESLYGGLTANGSQTFLF